ncbi:hypothetical protein NXH64_02725 [Butyrivibrio fibrisolvens]|uniref:hypothetical protein n=1 Tax=Pseudobutyrivibrio ruminis TaxID=46206 RepID=UPI0004138643|nr:hypothetical protein [Pseudobutyrivibrio ruminis]MDC7278410.1 hypothetical protein [Butyrivibrio fibrisolvens]
MDGLLSKTFSFDATNMLSKDYYNLLERTVNGETESFIYDNNVVSMSKSGNNYYYLQDELGSSMYMTNFTIF